MFRVKQDKSKSKIDICTLDETHRKKVAMFQKRKKLLPTKRRRLAQLQCRLTQLENMDPSKYTTDDIRNRSHLKTEIQELTAEINDIENNESEFDYYYKTESILMDYYNIIEREDHVLYEENPNLEDRKESHDSSEKMDHLDRLNQRSKENKTIKKAVKRKTKRNRNVQTRDIRDYLLVQKSDESKQENAQKITTGTTDSDNLVGNKAELFDSYMRLISSEYVTRKANRSPIRMCEECGTEKRLIHPESLFVCENCGEVEMIIMESEKPNYKEAITDTKPGYPYKRINHFNEWLAQFQAKESTEVSKEVYDKIIAELKKNRIHDRSRLDRMTVKAILKKLNLNQQYEHTTHIISKLSNRPPPTINRETEERLRFMFRQIQIPFEKHCPTNRINFLSYSYVLHKFCLLLELDDFLQCFPLLKSREKLRAQDKIWFKICQELNWEYHSSV